MLGNIELAKRNIHKSRNVKTVVLVTGSEEDRKRWQERLDKAAPYIFNRDKSTHILSLEEKIGNKTREGNFLGTILAYSRLKEEADKSKIKYRESVSLMGMLFGRGERMSPFTQIEGDSKPAISGAAEEALMFFAPVAGYLEKRGFRGILNNWADQTEIASIDLGGPPAEKEALSTYDIIKFVSVLEITNTLAEHKDWVVYDENSNMVSQVPRNKKDVLSGQLKALGVGKEYRVGVSLGPVAVSYQVLDIAKEVFAEDIRKQGVYLDFDPYVLMAFAMRGSRVTVSEGVTPDLFEKVNKVRDIFREKYKRKLNLKVLDLGGDIFWTEIGQHGAMREKYLLLNDRGPRGAIARKLEDIPDKQGKNGNIIVGSKISPDVEITDSVIINSAITGKGKIEGSVVKDSTINDIEMTEAFAVSSFRTGKTVLKKNSGIYKSLSSVLDTLTLEEGMRHGTLLTSEGPVDMTVAESTNLRDKENTYDIPIFGNKLSFKEAYDEMFGISAEELERRRTEALNTIKKIDEGNKKV